MYQSIKDNGYAETVPFVGLFSAGAFTNKLFAASKSGRIEEYSSNAVMYAISTNFLAVIYYYDYIGIQREADSLYVLLTDKPSERTDQDGSLSSSEITATFQDNSARISDILTDSEKRLFDDSNDKVIVSKRDPESAVASSYAHNCLQIKSFFDCSAPG